MAARVTGSGRDDVKEGIGMGIHICGNATAIAEDMVVSGALYFESDQKIVIGKGFDE